MTTPDIKWDPLGIGTTTFRPDILTRELYPGYEVTLLRKRAIGREHREAYDNEAAFLGKATREGIVGVPRLFRYNANNLEIEMEYIQGKQYAGYSYSTTDESLLKYPDDLEIQIKFLPLYVRTMDNVRIKTGMIKAKDNKAVDAIIVNNALNGIGDLVIIDWRWAEPVTDHKLRLALADAFSEFMYFPPDNFPPREYVRRIRNYLSTQDMFPLMGPREFRQQSASLERISKEIHQWLEVAPETPYKRIVKGLFQSTRYGPQDFVRDLVDYYSWIDKLRTISIEEIVRRETAYQHILNWRGERWLEGGIDLSRAEPWIKHLNDENQLRRDVPPNENKPTTLQSSTSQYEPPKRQVTPREAWEAYRRIGRVAAASQELDIAPTTLHQLIKEYEAQSRRRRF